MEWEMEKDFTGSRNCICGVNSGDDTMARMHRNITAEDLAVRQIMREYDLSESEARWFVEWAEKVINME